MITELIIETNKGATKVLKVAREISCDFFVLDDGSTVIKDGARISRAAPGKHVLRSIGICVGVRRGE